MQRQPTTKLAASGHRFLTRRLETALLGGDVDSPHDPVRAQSMSMVAGALLATVVIAVAVVLAFLHPQPTLGDASIALDRDSGALYVRVGDTMHPVLNLASARLIAGSDATPVAVSAAALATVPRGALLGIPGAPAVIAPPLPPEESGWTVCDAASGPSEPPSQTIVIVGTTSAPATQPMLLVAAASDPTAPSYLIYDGRRAAVDLGDPAVVRALRLDSVVPLPVSAGLLNLIPETTAITTPSVPSGPTVLEGFTAGSVVVVGAEYFVLLPDGVQRIGQVAADLLRSADSRDDTQPVAVAPDVMARLPVVESLAVTTFPDAVSAAPTGAAGPTTVCARWSPDGATASWLTDSLPASSTTALAQADGSGPAVDGIHLPGNRSAFVTVAGLHLVTGTGVSFGIADETAAEHLGLTAPAVPAPSAVLRLLPRGPELSRTNALVAYDTVGVGPGVPVGDEADQPR